MVSSAAPDPDGSGSLSASVSTFVYDAAGRLVLQTNGEGETRTFRYDAMGQVSQSTDGLGYTTYNRYDLRGNLIAEIDPAGNERSYSYDAFNRVLSETDHSGNTSSYEFDTRGRLDRMTDRNGRVMEYDYDELDRTTAEYWYADTIDADAGSYSDRLLWTYDLRGRIADNTFTYYGVPGSAPDYHLRQRYYYDGLDRVTEWENVNATGGSSSAPKMKQTYAYTPNFNYDIVSRTEYLENVIQGKETQLYSPFGELRSLTISDPNPNVGVNYLRTNHSISYDTAGRLSKTDRQLERVLNSGVFDTIARSQYTYDDADRLETLAHRRRPNQSFFTDLVEFSYDYDQAHRITQFSEDWNTGVLGLGYKGPNLPNTTERQRDYTYDAAGQLIDVENGLTTSSEDTYTYDANGNRVTHTVDGSSTAQDFTTGDDNRLTSDEQYSYTYDNEGNLTRRDSLADSSYTVYAWNHRNQLTAFDQYNSSGTAIASVDYWYNATGELVYRRSGGANKEYYAYSGGRRAFTAERDNGTGSYDIAARYAYGATGEPLMDQLFHTIGANQGEMSDLLFPLGDHQHSTRLVLDADDALAVRQTIEYTPFGEVDSVHDSLGVNDPTKALDTAFAHHGSVQDATTDLSHKAARWYDPTIGRFLTEDPIGEGTNHYRFAGNDPVNFADPSGLSQEGKPTAGGYSGGVSYSSVIGQGTLPGTMSGIGGNDPGIFGSSSFTTFGGSGSVRVPDFSFDQGPIEYLVNQSPAFSDRSNPLSRIASEYVVDSIRSNPTRDSIEPYIRDIAFNHPNVLGLAQQVSSLERKIRFEESRPSSRNQRGRGAALGRANRARRLQGLQSDVFQTRALHLRTGHNIAELYREAYFGDTPSFLGEPPADLPESTLGVIHSYPRVQGGLRLVGGGGEAFAAVTLAGTPAPGARPAALFVGLRAADNIATGAEILWTGELTDTYTKAAVTNTLTLAGVDPYVAQQWGTGIDVGADIASGLLTLRGAPASVARTNAQLVDDIGTRAGQWAQRSRQQSSLASVTPQTIGIKQHDYARRLLDRYQRMHGQRGLSTEVRYLDGVPWQTGDSLKGSIRLDVVEGALDNPTAVFDYKFGKAGLTNGRVNQIRAGADLRSNVPVIPVRP